MEWLIVEDCKSLNCSQFELVIAASQRTYDLKGGSTPLINYDKGDKNVIIALNELSQGKLNLKVLSKLALERAESANAGHSGALVQDKLAKNPFSIEDDNIADGGELDEEEEQTGLEGIFFGGDDIKNHESNDS